MRIFTYPKLTALLAVLSVAGLAFGVKQLSTSKNKVEAQAATVTPTAPEPVPAPFPNARTQTLSDGEIISDTTTK